MKYLKELEVFKIIFYVILVIFLYYVFNQFFVFSKNINNIEQV